MAYKSFEDRAHEGIPAMAKRLCEHPEAIESLLWECVHAESIRFRDNGTAYWNGNGKSIIPGEDLIWDD